MKFEKLDLVKLFNTWHVILVIELTISLLNLFDSLLFKVLIDFLNETLIGFLIL